MHNIMLLNYKNSGNNISVRWSCGIDIRVVDSFKQYNIIYIQDQLLYNRVSFISKDAGFC